MNVSTDARFRVLRARPRAVLSPARPRRRGLRGIRRARRSRCDPATRSPSPIMIPVRRRRPTSSESSLPRSMVSTAFVPRTSREITRAPTLSYPLVSRNRACARKARFSSSNDRRRTRSAARTARRDSSSFTRSSTEIICADAPERKRTTGSVAARTSEPKGRYSPANINTPATSAAAQIQGQERRGCINDVRCQMSEPRSTSGISHLTFHIKPL